MIIDRHLLRQVAMPSFLVSTVLSVIFVGYSLSRFLVKADAGLLNSNEVIYLTLLKVLIALEVLLPIGLFFGLMLGLGKLHSDSEMVAMQAGGIGEYRILRPVLSLAVPLAILVAVLSLHVRPWAFAKTYGVLAIAEASSDIDRIKAGQFYLTRDTAPEVTAGSQQVGLDSVAAEDRERAIFIERISPDQNLEDVFIRTRIGNELQVISSNTGILVGQADAAYNILELDSARIFKRVIDGPDLYARIEHFSIRVKTVQPEPPAYKAKAERSARLKLSDNPKDQAEYQWRQSTPITTLLLALLVVPLSRSQPRQGRYAKLLLAFAIYAAYYNLIGINRTWVEQQTTASIWWTPCLLALVVVAAYIPWHRLRSALGGVRRE